MVTKYGFERAAKRLRLSIEPYASIKGSSTERRSVFRISDGSKELFTLGATILSTSYIGMKIAADKATTNEILRQNNLPTTEQLLIEDAPSLARFYTKHHGDILLKPLGSTVGRGIYASLQSLDETQEAFQAIKKEFTYVVAEKKIRGREYRVLVFKDQVLAVAEFIPPTLIGNGRDTILMLIERHNTAIEPDSGCYPIPIKPELTHILAEQGLLLGLIPEAGRVVTLYFAAPISHGGTATDATDRLHPANRKIFLEAARSIYLNIAGIDVITEDIGQPLAETGGVIIEINGGPDLSLHRGSAVRPDFDAAEEILRLFFGISS
jgi:cyanophycin synthetase